MSEENSAEATAAEAVEEETRPPAWLLWLYVAYIVWAGAYLGLYLFGA